MKHVGERNETESPHESFEKDEIKVGLEGRICHLRLQKFKKHEEDEEVVEDLQKKIGQILSEDVFERGNPVRIQQRLEIIYFLEN